ncbi:DUF362 domain-containing protein [Abyssisolibacter fermentans]|uniref:DUF362 domain-containing protein n=1 Tax=Abyssisolibacter fermentans TaxID=1766203 RepID=UPI0009EC9C49|nr:DUF362 domain-containing protein [Abyssisolibacter fermentans]
MINIVSLDKCNNYEYSKVKDSILKSFDNLGGIEKYINKKDRVLLKLNLVIKKSPDKAATTHPTFVKALAEVLIEYGAEVIIGDSPGGPFNKAILKSIYNTCQISNIAEETGAKLNFNTNSMQVSFPDGKLLKRLTVTQMLEDVDKVISVSKLKTHCMMLFTGAVKNQFGIIPGSLKSEYHFKMPEVKDFADALVDICLYANPVLSFMDGIVGMEGDGPTSGNPRQIGAVIASNSPYHLDVVASSIINIDAKKIPTINSCINRGICSGSLDDIKLVGDNIDDFMIKDFKMPIIRCVDFVSDRFPQFVSSLCNKLLQPKPIFIHDDCTGCGKCANSCPPKIIEMKDNRPVVDLDNCIRCFCCHELCPKKAIEIYRPPLMRLLSKL